MQTQELVTLIPWTFIAQILNLFLQMWLIKKFLFKPISNILEKRRELAEKELTEARKTQAEADAAKAEYTLALSEAKGRAEEIITSATAAAQEKNDEILRLAEAQAAALKNKAEADIELEKKKALNDLKDEIGGLAMDIAGKVVEREISEDDHRKLVDELISRVGDAV